MYCFCWIFFSEKNDNFFLNSSFVATTCCNVRKLLTVDVTLMTSSKTLRSLSFEQGTITTVFKHSFYQTFSATFEFLRLRIVAAIFPANRQIFSVQRNSSLNRPSPRLLCFLCRAQKVRGKIRVELAENLSVQPPLRKQFHSFFIAGRMQSNNRARIRLDRASLYPSPTLQIS